MMVGVNRLGNATSPYLLQHKDNPVDWREWSEEAFEEARAVVDAAPEDWRSWYHLAFAYDAAGDRRRARESLRTASRLHRGR